MRGLARPRASSHEDPRATRGRIRTPSALIVEDFGVDAQAAVSSTRARPAQASEGAVEVRVSVRVPLPFVPAWLGSCRRDGVASSARAPVREVVARWVRRGASAILMCAGCAFVCLLLFVSIDADRGRDAGSPACVVRGRPGERRGVGDASLLAVFVAGAGARESTRPGRALGSRPALSGAVGPPRARVGDGVTGELASELISDTEVEVVREGASDACRRCLRCCVGVGGSRA